ncbi:MAG TPA: MFS transporter [Polyangia bacterium]
MAAPRFPVAIFVFAFLGWTFDFYDLVLLGFLKDGVVHDLGMSHAMEGWLLGAGLGASGFGGLVAGALADRFGKRRVLAGTVLIYSVGSAICGSAPTALVFFLGRIVQGIGIGGEWAIGHGMLAEAVPPSFRGRAAAFLQAGEPFGVFIAAIVGYLVLPRVGWRAVLIGSSATALLAVAVRASSHLPDEPSRAHSILAELRTAARTAGLPGRFVRAWLLGVFKLGTYWSCYTWLPSFLSKQMHQSIGRSLTWMITAQVGQFLGMLSFGAVSDRLGRRPAFALYSVLTAAAIGTLAARWAELLPHPALFWAVMFALGVGSGCTAGFGALLAELYPTEVRTAAMGATYNLARTAQLATPVVVGVAVAHWGLAGGLGVPTLLALATASWVWVLPETRGIALPRLASSTARSDGLQ